MYAPFALRIATAFFAETVGDFLLFPIWWYSKGLLRMARGIGGVIARRERQLALGLWVKNLLKPMYGQEDWQGKLISFIFRVLVLLWRSIIFSVWLLLVMFLFIVYFVLPLLIFYALLQNV